MKRVKTNFGAAVAVLSVATLIALPVRVYQYLKLIEKGSGFFLSWTNPTVFGLYGLCALTIVLILALSIKGGKKTLYGVPSGKNMTLAVTSGLFGLTLISDGIYQVHFLLNINSGKIAAGELVLGDGAGKSMPPFITVSAVFAFLAAAYFLFVSYSYFTGKNKYTSNVLLSVCPVLWAVARLMIRFMQTISYKYVSELLFEMLMIAFSALFFIGFARFSAGLMEKRTQMRIFGYGALTVFFSLLCAVPRYILLIMGRTDVLYRHSSLYQFCDVGMVLFVAASVFAIMGEMQYKEVSNYEAQQEE